MTEKELAKKAFEYRKELVPYTELGYPDVAIPVYGALDIDRAYVAGVKENGLFWHDLRKNPNDLPPQDNTSISDYVITDRGVGYYNGRVKSWWVKNDHALTDKVIAWCEIPKFEVEE